MIPVILSGGSGTRLWPLSRTKAPKQFCHFFEQTLQEMTIRRLSPLGPAWIVTNKGLKDQTSLQMKNLGLPLDQLVLEPMAKNTAPAIALLCQVLELRGKGNEVAAVFPADHLVANEASFLKALKLAEQSALRGQVVTLGIQPDSPATGYGYIQVTGEAKSLMGAAAPVERFHEKPDLQTATAFVTGGKHFWNAGIFVFRVSTMIALFKKHQPEIWQRMESLKSDLSNLTDIYQDMKSISIDYAILEKLGSTTLSCVPCDIGWSDVGSWDAIAEIDRTSGELEGKNQLFQVDSGSNYVLPFGDKTYAFAGVSHLIVVDTKDAILITQKGQSQKVKDVVEALKPKRPELLQQHIDEERPWGGFEVLKDTDTFKSKVVIVNPGQQISYQSHNKREEHWLVVQGTGVVILDGETIPVSPGTYVKIPLKAKHRIRNTGAQVMKFVEVQLGSYFGEDDIIRYQDDYLRE